MIYVFQILGVIGLILSAIAGLILSTAGPAGLGLATAIGGGGAISSLMLLAIASVLSRLDRIASNTADIADALEDANKALPS